mgnify:CR=1 FL=1
MKLQKRIGEWFCWMEWHSVHQSGFDGASATGRCSRCRLRCLQDSQGGWFAASRQDDEGVPHA